MTKCPVCRGKGCGICQFSGHVLDSGPALEHNPGQLAVKPCGCAVDWISDLAKEAQRIDRYRLWLLQGFKAEACEWNSAAPRLELGNQCQHRE